MLACAIASVPCMAFASEQVGMGETEVTVVQAEAPAADAAAAEGASSPLPKTGDMVAPVAVGAMVAAASGAVALGAHRRMRALADAGEGGGSR